MFLSHHTIKSEANSIYRKLGTSARSQAVCGLASWDSGGVTIPNCHPVGGSNPRRYEVQWCPVSGGVWARTVRLQEILRRLAMIDEGSVEERRVRIRPAGASAWMPGPRVAASGGVSGHWVAGGVPGVERRAGAGGGRA